MSRYGERTAVTRLLRGAFEAAVHFDMRVPELFCGFPRVPGSSPVAYPVACLPQAWAAGSAFMLVQSCLGLTVDGVQGDITLDRPRLPIGIDEIVVRRLMLGAHCVDLVIKQFNGRVGAFLAVAAGLVIAVGNVAWYAHRPVDVLGSLGLVSAPVLLALGVLACPTRGRQSGL